MSLVSLCIVGKDNEPLYLRDFVQTKTKSGTESENETESPSTYDPFGFFDKGTENSPVSCSLQYQFLMHAALDRFEELTGPNHGGGGGNQNYNHNRWRTPGSTGNDAMWVGLLCPVDNFRVYGYLTTTNVKLIGVMSSSSSASSSKEVSFGGQEGSMMDSASSVASGSSSTGTASGTTTSKREAELRAMFAKIHALYVNYTLNPFTKLKSQIVSQRFYDGVESLVHAFNNPSHST